MSDLETQSETPNTNPIRSLPEAERMTFLPALFPGCFMLGEGAVFGWADRFSATYGGGGYWDFRTNDAGLRYMVPLGHETFHVEQTMNGYEGDMSADAYGIFCTLMGLNQMMSRHHDNEQLFANFEILRDYAYEEHPEARALIAALD